MQVNAVDMQNSIGLMIGLEFGDTWLKLKACFLKIG